MPKSLTIAIIGIGRALIGRHRAKKKAKKAEYER